FKIYGYKGREANKYRCKNLGLDIGEDYSINPLYNVLPHDIDTKEKKLVSPEKLDFLEKILKKIGE
ncbi:hypothetical protein ACFL1H_06325, partial [Nanoarchaeota archaeon]